ncbi:MAG TPA: right-handed parallel beta-helix repeat-containing protein [Bryobacteraceae bacterium]|nr:right-handed parallel beta-helix repeat-containing protein [Bryobacteraceae bacterium]
MHSNVLIRAFAVAAMVFVPRCLPQESVQQEASPASYELDIRTFGAECGGGDDAGAVQAAIDALPDGSTLLVPCVAGIGPSGITLRGKAHVTVRGVNGGGFTALGSTNTRVMFSVASCFGCTIRDLVIEGRNRGVAAIGLESCTMTTVRDNVISNIGYPAQAAIVGMANRDNRYTGNSITNTGVLYDPSGNIVDATRGIWLGNESSAYYESFPYVSDNRFLNIGGTAIVAHAFSPIIEGNTGEKLIWSGVKVVAPASAGGTTRIESNSFKGIGGRYSGGGIQIGSEPNNHETFLIRNNTLEGEIESGVYVARGPFSGRIVDNTIRNSVQAGITFVCSASGVFIGGNHIENDGPGKFFNGIRVLADKGMAIRDFEIASNQIRGQTENGILLQTNGGTIDRVFIHSNSLAKLNGFGVFIDEKATANTIRDVRVNANCFIENRMGLLRDNRPLRLAQPSVVCLKQ